MNLDAYIQMQKEELCKLSSAAVVNIEQYKEETYNAWMKYFMKRKWPFKDRTFEEAEEYYKRNCSIFDDETYSCSYEIHGLNMSLEKAKKYLTIAVTGDYNSPVFVSANDYGLLLKWRNCAK